MPATGRQQQVSRRKEIGSRLEQLHDTLDMIGEHTEKLGKAQGLELTLHSRILARLNEAEASLHQAETELANRLPEK